VKVTLGFLEMALAFKFLSNADLVMHWGLLKREIFIGIWIITGIGMSLYLFGLLKFSKYAVKEKLSVGRKIIATVVASFTLYLIPGITNSSYANLKLISGFPPPLYYSVYEKDSDCILGLDCSKDYFTGLDMAKKANKPILLDFTGYACVNCRRMEENVWSDARVNEYLRDKFVVISMYVDDKKNLPALEQFDYTLPDGKIKRIKTVGDLWTTMETINFANNAQPLYVIIDPQERLLAKPVGYTPDKEAYLNWLRCGWEQFDKNK
jgi:thiol:disulfide interchange protein DsbD